MGAYIYILLKYIAPVYLFTKHKPKNGVKE